LQAKSGTAYPVDIIDNPHPNAYADGKRIAITTGAINQLDDDEIASFLAHEIAHNKAGHIKKREERIDDFRKEVEESLTRPKGFFRKIASATVTGVVGLANCRAADREEEYEADEKGQKIIGEAGFKEDKAAPALEKADPQNSGGTIFSTHPETRRRVRRIKKQE
jgi:Zn-dependent protease with chaperone function